MKTITIGRSPDNDIVLEKDIRVSRHHCQIIQNNSGNFIIIDFGSTNGTYVNGWKINRESPLKKSDEVIVGNTRLNWQQYFNGIKWEPRIIDNPEINPYTEEKNKAGIGIAALITSIIGFLLIGYAAILFAKWGIFAWVGRASTLILVSLVLHVLALIISKLADYKDSAAEIAEGISSFCITMIIGLYLYIRFEDSNFFNPFK